MAFEPIPAGKYVAAIIASEMKRTKNGLGQYLKLTFRIVDGKHKGRQLFANLNLDNPNQDAVQIARSELSAICRAVGVMQPQDSTALHNLPLSIRVALGVNKDTGEKTNNIKGYENKSAALSQPTVSQPAGQSQQPAGQVQQQVVPPQTDGPAPWGQQQ